MIGLLAITSPLDTLLSTESIRSKPITPIVFKEAGTIHPHQQIVNMKSGNNTERPPRDRLGSFLFSRWGFLIVVEFSYPPHARVLREVLPYLPMSHLTFLHFAVGSFRSVGACPALAVSSIRSVVGCVLRIRTTSWLHPLGQYANSIHPQQRIVNNKGKKEAPPFQAGLEERGSGGFEPPTEKDESAFVPTCCLSQQCRRTQALPQKG